MSTQTVKWEVDGWLKHAEEDSHEEGCLPDTGTSFTGRDHFEGKTLHELVDQLWAFVPFKRDDDAIDFDCCEDAGRIDIQGMEDVDGNEPSDQDFVEWRAGRMKLWAVTYSFQVELVTREAEIELTRLPGTCPTCTDTLTPPNEEDSGRWPPNYCMTCDRQIAEEEVIRPWQKP